MNPLLIRLNYEIRGVSGQIRYNVSGEIRQTLRLRKKDGELD